MPKNDPKIRLSGVDLTMVSLVPAGDDPMAKTVIFKSDPDLGDDKSNNRMSERPTMPGNTSKERRMPKDQDEQVITKDDLPDEVVEYIDALEAQIDVYKAADEADDDGDDDEDDADEDESDDDADEDDDEDTSKGDPVIKAAVAAAVAQVRKDFESKLEKAEQVAKQERDERLRRDFVAKAEKLPMISENPTELGSVLKELNDLSPKLAGKIEKMLGAANEAIASGNLFGEIGDTGQPTTVEKSLDATAKGLQKADPNLTYEQAVAKALEDDPDLYNQYLSEK